MFDAWLAASQLCDALAKALEEVRPPVIDYFLFQNPALREVGKLMIAWVILDCEAQYRIAKGNLNRVEALANSPLKREQQERAGYDVTKCKDAWCRFIISKLVSGCKESEELLKNNVTFVTFNYDISLEYYVYTALKQIEMFGGVADAFFREHPVLHVYGQVRNYPGSEFTPINLNLIPCDAVDMSHRDPARAHAHYRECKRAIDEAYSAAQKMRTIGSDEKDNNVEELERARTAIKQAECVYILGYGFDEENSRQLHMQSNLLLHNGPRRAVVFTNYGDSNRINKKAAKLLFGHFSQFLPPHELVQSDPKFYCEKSTRDVYQALDQDFDSIESEDQFPVS